MPKRLTEKEREHARRVITRARYFENNTIILNEPEEHCYPRIWHISQKLKGMLTAYPHKGERLFEGTDTRTKQHILKLQRNRLAEKLGLPRLRMIHFHALRTWKATMTQHETHDQKQVQLLLGQKSILSTEHYVIIEKTVFNQAYNDDFIVKTASTLEEASKLLEVGFDYIMEMNGHKVFRKRK